MKKNIARLATLAMVLMFVLSACGGAPAATQASATQAPATTGFQIPDIQSGKFNVAVFFIGFPPAGGRGAAPPLSGPMVSPPDPNISAPKLAMLNSGPPAEIPSGLLRPQMF